MPNLKIDPEFRDKIPPLTVQEFQQLEDNIVKDGKVRDPLVVWNDTIIDGHNRWAIIQKHPEIPYTTTPMDFPDKWAAIVWMCQNQLGKRNLTDGQKSYLRGKQYEAEKMSVPNAAGKNQHSEVSGQNVRQPTSDRETKDGTAGRIGKQYGVDGKTIRRDEKFAKGLDVADAVSPGFKDSILTGAVKAHKSVIASLPKLDEPERKKAVQAIQNGERVQPIKPQEPEIIESTCTEYNSDDLKMELDACTVTFYRNFKDTLVFHSTMAQEPECRKKIEAALIEAEAAIKKIRGIIS